MTNATIQFVSMEASAFLQSAVKPANLKVAGVAGVFVGVASLGVVPPLAALICGAAGFGGAVIASGGFDATDRMASAFNARVFGPNRPASLAASNERHNAL